MKKDLIIFGAGVEGQQALQQLRKERVQYFVDNNPTLHGKQIDGIKIISFEMLKAIPDDYHIIIATQKHYVEIKKQLDDARMADVFNIYQFLIKEKFESNCGICNRVILMNSHDNTNIGDHLISVAELYFFKKYLPEYDVIEIPAGYISRNMMDIKSFIRKTDILAITGGGFLGSLWLTYGEEHVRNILQKFPENKIVIFPQTLFFEDTENGNEQRAITKAIYNQHPDLTICFRDRTSYDLGNQLFRDNVRKLYLPDMVTLLDRSDEIDEREGIGLCLRTDKESILSKSDIEQIKEVISAKGIGYIEFSMHAIDSVSTAQRMDAINSKLSVIQKSQLIITDRLHCMLLCAVSGTPCIALDNLSGKVKGVYEWIKNNGYIKLAENPACIGQLVGELWATKGCIYKNEEIKRAFDQLAEEFRIDKRERDNAKNL